MKISIERIFCGQEYTIGRLSIDGECFCDTIEDTVRALPSTCPNTSRGVACQCKEKIYSRTAIPPGVYPVTLEYSPRLKKMLPRLHNVPHFLGVLIHSGNDQKASAGCIIVGKNRVKGKVLESRATLNGLLKRLEGRTDITIEIV